MVGERPLSPKICAESDPPLSEKRRLRQISAYNKKFNYGEYEVDHALSNEL